MKDETTQPMSLQDVINFFDSKGTACNNENIKRQWRMAAGHIRHNRQALEIGMRPKAHFMIWEGQRSWRGTFMWKASLNGQDFKESWIRLDSFEKTKEHAIEYATSLGMTAEFVEEIDR